MKKIAFVGNYLWDMYNFRGDIIKEIGEMGYDVTIIAPKDKESMNFIDENLKIKNILIDLNRKSLNPLFELKVLLQLYKIYKKERYDLIFHYTIKPNIYGNIIAALQNIKSISIVPGTGYSFSKKGIMFYCVKKLYAYSFKKSKEVWFLNEEDRTIFVSEKIIPIEKTKVLPSEGINLMKFKKKEESKTSNEKIVFLMIARILWDKGFKEYIEAAKLLKEKYENVEFQLLGMIDEGNPNGVPKETVYKYHNSKIINYIGTSKNVSTIIQKCDCVVLPSFYKEGIPRTLMEGAALEKPLITTNNVGCKEVVDNEKNGFICNINDSRDLAEKMEKIILMSKEERILMGKNGREKMEKEFDYKLVLKYYKNKILELEKERS